VYKKLLTEPRFRAKTLRIFFAILLALGVLAVVRGFVTSDGLRGVGNGAVAIVVSLVILFLVVPWDLRRGEPDDK
jgi:hypothetical protein